MFNFLRRLLCLAVILSLAFLAISIRSGGERFRWFGHKVQFESDKVGRSADNIKKTAGSFEAGAKKIESGAKNAAGHVKNTLVKAEGIVNGIRKK